MTAPDAKTDEDANPDRSERTTAPMSSIDVGQATLGLLVALIGLAIVFGVPIATTAL